MKIRIKGDTVRLRLSQGEVDAIGKFQTVSEHTNFADNVFTYSLVVSQEIQQISASFNHNKMEVLIPQSMASLWSSTDQVGIESVKDSIPSVLIEKDFQCLTERGEDESDLFTNPNTVC